MNTKIIAIALILIVALPVGAGYCLNFEDVTHTEYNVTSTENVTDSLLNDEIETYLYYNSYLNNAYNYSSSYGVRVPIYSVSGSTVTSIPNAMTQTGPILYNATTAYAALDLSDIYKMEAEIDDGLTIKYIKNDGQTVEKTYADNGHTYDLTYLFNIVTVENLLMQTETIKNVVGIEYKSSTSGTIEVSTWKYSTATSYYDWTQGWKRNGTGSDWFNGSINNEVLMTVTGVSSYSAFTMYNDSYTSLGGIYLTKDSNGVISVGKSGSLTTETLGKYDYVRMLFTADNVQIYGVTGSSFPALDATVKPYKTITINTASSGNISYIRISDSNTVCRVDHTTIPSSSYPAIVNNTYNPVNLYPGITDYQITLSKIGAYGSSITIGGTAYPVTNGHITVSGKNIDLENAVIKSIKNGPVWNNYINGKQLSDTNTVGTVTFTGAWSAIVTHSTLQQSTYTMNEWVPGHYGLDATDACLVGLMGCLAVFIALGLYGHKSGAKVWPLMIVCGSAALIFLCII